VRHPTATYSGNNKSSVYSSSENVGLSISAIFREHVNKWDGTEGKGMPSRRQQHSVSREPRRSR